MLNALHKIDLSSKIDESIMKCYDSTNKAAYVYS